MYQHLAALIEQRLGLAVQQKDLQGVQANLADLQEAPLQSAVWQQVIDHITVTESYFFRNPSQFAALADHLLPQAHRPTIWSVGCAMGEEPYSAAMMLLGKDPTPEALIVGTDISERAIAAARRGLYRDWSFRVPMAVEALSTHFSPCDGGHEIHDTVRDRVLFRQGSLLDGSPLPALDVIMCRNVLLYFSDAQRRRAEKLLFDALRPGGWLLLGEAETIHTAGWEPHTFDQTVIYRRPLQPTRQTTTPPNEHVYEGALRAYRTEDYAQAERQLTTWLAAYPDHAPAHVLMAGVLANRKDITEAHHHLDVALQVQPLDANAHYLRAVLHMAVGNDTEAAKALRAALYSQPNHLLAILMLHNISPPQKAARLRTRGLRLAAELPPEKPVSDLSDLTADAVTRLLR